MDVRAHIGRSAGRFTHPWYWHFVVKMNSNLADLPLDQPADQPPKNKQQQMQCIILNILWDVFGSHFGFFKKKWEFLFISE